MEYLIFSGAALLLAWSLSYWDSHQTPAPARHVLVPRVVGVLAHLGAVVALGWIAGPWLGLVALFAIPLAASVIHGLLIRPRRRARWLGGRSVGRSRARAEPRAPDRHIAERAGMRALR